MFIIRKARETGLAAAMTLAVVTMSFAGSVTGAHAASGAAPRVAVQVSGQDTEGLVQLVDGRDRDWHRDDRRGGQRDGYHDRGRGHHWGRMDAREIRRSLRHQGYRHIRILGERGRVYIASATGWRGMPLRLVVDSRSGAVISREPIGRGHHWEYRW
ncbi:hypothetical protein [Roseibium litorale]|uniref:YpeB-like protein with protease inhibitory function n=1 Tax=Roseibium litorale TaxID=2803841 RepID=A0ABR9CSE7_9HYPH|nr:hypothetical protein [Roseibium litorale]MBD8893798.1 hypothetical protein [Roseibium litorale]